MAKSTDKALEGTLREMQKVIADAESIKSQRNSAQIEYIHLSDRKEELKAEILALEKQREKRQKEIDEEMRFAHQEADKFYKEAEYLKNCQAEKELKAAKEWTLAQKANESATAFLNDAQAKLDEINVKIALKEKELSDRETKSKEKESDLNKMKSDLFDKNNELSSKEARFKEVRDTFMKEKNLFNEQLESLKQEKSVNDRKLTDTIQKEANLVDRQNRFEAENNQLQFQIKEIERRTNALIEAEHGLEARKKDLLNFQIELEKKDRILAQRESSIQATSDLNAIEKARLRSISENLKYRGYRE